MQKVSFINHLLFDFPLFMSSLYNKFIEKFSSSLICVPYV